MILDFSDDSESVDVWPSVAESGHIVEVCSEKRPGLVPESRQRLLPLHASLQRLEIFQFMRSRPGYVRKYLKRALELVTAVKPRSMGLMREAPLSGVNALFCNRNSSSRDLKTVVASPVQLACNELRVQFPTAVYQPTEQSYVDEVRDVWSETCITTPSCVFEPATTQQLAEGLCSIVAARSKFSVRSRGHMPVPEANGVNNGVFISMKASATENPDLFWALKGGGNNFGIVTQFEMRTMDATNIYGGSTVYTEEQCGGFLDALGAYITPSGGSQDARSSAVIGINIDAELDSTTCAMLSFFPGQDSSPKAFSNFTSLESSFSGNSVSSSFVEYTNLTNTPAFSAQTSRWLFATAALKVGEATIPLINRTFIETVRSRLHLLQNKTSVAIGLSVQPITRSWLQAARDAGGDAIDLDPADGPFIALVMNLDWENAEDDLFINRLARDFVSNVNRASKREGLYFGFNYMNDAHRGQPIFEHYGSRRKSLPRLKQIQRQYDRTVPTVKAGRARSSPRTGSRGRRQAQQQEDDDDDAEVFWAQRTQYRQFGISCSFAWLNKKPQAQDMLAALSRVRIRCIARQVGGLSMLVHQDEGAAARTEEMLMRIEDRLAVVVGVRRIE
ncbi:hypothetical protein BST61_g7553 [Cercospora zeina]